MGFGLQWLVDKITFPAPPSSYSLTSHPELFFVRSPRSRPSYPGVPCMLYSIPQGAPILLVHAHSNGCDIGDMRQTLQNISESLRVHVMSFEFPGYGLHVGAASMRAIDEAAIAVSDYLQHDLKVSAAQIVWYGRSIGSGPALRMVHRISKELQQRPGGVVLQCGYANFPEVAGHLFGRVAKRLVRPLWPNEAMVKDLECPVLLIHGRKDTMIPISQSEKLWNAVSNKSQSHFHACDCGHNDFNFRRCTLRPIYDFLLGVISASDFPAANFTVEILSQNQAHVHHIGPLRSRIPVYSFRRPELEEWLRRLVRRCKSFDTSDDSDQGAKALADGPSELQPGQRVVLGGLPAESGAPSNGQQGVLEDFDAAKRRWRLRLDYGESVWLAPENLSPAGEQEEGSGEAGSQSLGPVAHKSTSLKAIGREVSKAAEPGKKRGKADASPSPSKPKGKRKRKADQPPIPDFSQMGPVEEVDAALLQAEGMVRTCAIRVAAFLDRVQCHLDRIDDLEKKPMDEIVDMVEALFRTSDPLLCLWEEVEIASGKRIKIRLGPFVVDNAGRGSYDPQLPGGPAAPEFLRIPLWHFSPSPAHFRCLAEWSLLHSERLERSLPGSDEASRASGCCCCVPSVTGRRRSKRAPPASGRAREGVHPSRGTLATSLAAHFVHWVERNDDVKSMFSRFAALYKSPEDALRGPPLVGVDAVCAMAPKEISDLPPNPPSGFDDDSPDGLGAHLASGEAVVFDGSEAAELPSGFFPCSPAQFSALARAMLREGMGSSSLSHMAELQASVWGAHGDKGVCDFEQTARLVAGSPGPEAPLGDAADAKRLDWAAARLALHYERLLAGASVAPPPPPRALGGAETGGAADPLRAEARAAGSALNRAMKAFAQGELQERRQSLQGQHVLGRRAPELASLPAKLGSTQDEWQQQQQPPGEAQRPEAAGQVGGL